MTKLPEGWGYHTVGDVSVLVTSGSRDWAQYYASHGALFIRMGNLTRGDIQLKLDDIQYVHIPVKNDEGKRTRLKAGDVLISITAELGKLGYLDHDIGEAYINQHVALVRIENKNINSKFFAYWLALPSSNQLLLLLNDAGTKAGLNLPTIKNLEFPAPDIQQQNKIVEILSFWDQRIGSIESLLQAKREHKRALMQRLLDIRFNDNECWKEYRLGDLFKERVDTRHLDLPLLSITREKGVIPRGDVERKDTSNEDKSKYLRICVGDIGYNTMRMWQGVSALSSLEGIVSPAYTILIPSDKIDGQFAAYLFKYTTIVHLFQRYSQGLTSDTWNLKYPHFAEIKVHIPPLPEQRKIAAALSAADREIDQLTQKLDAYKQQKKGLMQQLLTGKKRVKLDYKEAA